MVLKDANSKPEYYLGNRFNPCCSGNGAERTWWKHGLLRLQKVSILVVLEMVLKGHCLLRDRDLLLCFNPCCSGNGAESYGFCKYLS